MARKSQTSSARGEIPTTSENDAGGKIPTTPENGKTGMQAGLVRIRQVKRSHMKRLAEKPASEKAAQQAAATWWKFLYTSA